MFTLSACQEEIFKPWNISSVSQKLQIPLNIVLLYGGKTTRRRDSEQCVVLFGVFLNFSMHEEKGT